MSGSHGSEQPGRFGSSRSRGRPGRVVGPVLAIVLSFALCAGLVVGAPSAGAVATVPSVPATPSVGQSGLAITAYWAAPADDGGSPLTGYHLEVTGAATIAVDVGVVTNTSIPVPDHGGYQVTVAAVNAIGTGPATPPQPITVHRPATPPRNVTVTPGDHQAFVRFDAPADTDGLTINSCTATAMPGSIIGSAPSPIPLAIIGLTNGVTYSVTVFCTTRYTVSYPNPGTRYVIGQSSAPVTVVPGAPNPPTVVTAGAGNHEASVSWTVPSPSDVTSSVVTPYLGAVAQTPVVVPGTAGFTRVTGLPNGTTYTFTVAFTNPAGTGAESAPSNAITTNEVPGAPTGVTASAGFTQATVSWTPPASDGGSLVLWYVITPYLGGVAQPSIEISARWPGCLPDPQISCPVTSTTVTGLDHNAYTFTVTAKNVLGAGPESAPSAPVTPTGPPGAPTAVTAVAAKESAVVSWAPPPSDGGAPITRYEVSPTDSGGGCEWTSGPLTCTVSDLVPGEPVMFTVIAITDVAASDPSAASNSVTPWSGSSFHPVTPTRLLDSRTATGGWNTKLSSASARQVVVSPAGPVPAGATAVEVNVTVTNGDAGSFVTVWPSGTPKPTSSTINFPAGATIANFTTTRVGTEGALAVANEVGSVDVIIDVVGYYDDGPGDLFHGTTPTRYLDSRGPVGGWNGPLVAGSPRALTVRGAGLLPATATTVIANVTVTSSTAGSFVSMWPTGAPPPVSSMVNFGAFQTIPNLVTLRIGANGTVMVSTAVGAVDVVVDVVGWFDSQSGARFHAVDPARVLDSRNGTGLTGPWSAGSSRTLPLADVAPFAGGEAIAVSLNMTATNGTAGSFLTVWPTGVAQPTASSLNFGVGQTIANRVVTPLGSGGAVQIANVNGEVSVIADVVGYFAPY